MEILNLIEEKANLLASSKSIREAIAEIVDEGSFVEVGALSFAATDSILGKSGEGVITGYGLVDGVPCYLFAQNSEVLAGGFSKAHAEKIANIYAKAASTATPVIGILDSYGARINDGISALEGYALFLGNAARFSGIAPQICVVLGQACGVISSFASLCDYCITLDKSVLATVSPAVMSGKENSKHPGEKLIGSDFAEKCGISSLTVKKADLKEAISAFLNFTVCEDDFAAEDMDGNAIYSNDVSSEQFVKALADNGEYLELNKNYGLEIKTYLLKLAGKNVGLSFAEGKLSADSIKKTARFVQMLDLFEMPYISVVSSDGLKVSLKEEEKGLSKEYAKLIYVLAAAFNVKLSVVAKCATGASYVALASKNSNFDNVVAFDGAVISPLSSDTAVEVYFADVLKTVEDKDALREKLLKTYEEEKANAIVAAKDGYVDNVIEPAFIKNYLVSALQMLLYKNDESAISGNMPL
ncbi:MAG: hypothetical protein IKB66_01465 [Clostridia bacterium]|nr:hypothetical protein [Clostridia bacterium]